MTKEKMQQEMKRLADERQDTFIKKLLIDVQWLEDKAIKAKYEPTQNERYIFNEIRNILNNMNKWF